MSDKPQKIGCYVQKCAVICAVTEDVNLSWEGCGRGRKQLKCCRVVMMNSISGSVSLLFKDTGSRRYLDCRFPIRSRPGGMGN